jgi:hypothetical protein
MRFDGDFPHDLLIECHPAGHPAQTLQQLVIVSFASAQAPTVQVKGHSRDQD